MKQIKKEQGRVANIRIAKRPCSGRVVQSKMQTIMDQDRLAMQTIMDQDRLAECMFRRRGE